MSVAEGSAVHRATILDPDDPDDRQVLDELTDDVRIEFVDRRTEQIRSLAELHPAVRGDLADRPTRWAYYPWRRVVVGILGENAFRTLRLDRNRNLITVEEQARLAELTIGVVGLSVGHIIAHTLAAEGLCGRLRLADFDELELSNLNRVPATVFDLGLNKATVAARRIAELDPYLDVEVLPMGVTADSLDGFADGLDIVVEECDSLEVKAMVREAARARQLPVLMATSDRGLIDVERYDLDPHRPILHGLLGDVDSTKLAGLSSRERIPYTLRHADPTRSSPRMTASMVEVGRTLSSWPQLVGEVTMGAAVIAEAVRRIGLGEPLSSGQARVDVADALDDLTEPSVIAESPEAAPPTAPAVATDTPSSVPRTVAAAAVLAPSGGNAQPWHIEVGSDAVVIRLAPERTSMMDVAYRGSAVAVGAAAFNAKVAAAAHDMLGKVELSEGDPDTPLRAAVRLSAGTSPRLAHLYQAMLNRETSRHRGDPEPLTDETVDLLHRAVDGEGGRLTLLTERSDISEAAAIFAAADRIRYLTPALHQEMFTELRFAGDRRLDSGIDVRSLELDDSDRAVLEVLRRPDVMVELARWDAGTALGQDVSARVEAASALAVVSVHGSALTDFAQGGAAVEAMWIQAQQSGLAVHPLSPVFLHAVTPEELTEMSPSYSAELQHLQSGFRRLARTPSGDSLVLVLKLARAPRSSLRSRRRELPGELGGPS
ncbi:MAG: Rv1355c family protein [Mycobacterium sp.]